ncbi:hypothetical protein BCEN4_740045 [Burkholderia cenocepacia]|nr:hypothetical protein BCEN4_740045 [Burkholderia cenocepacia]
MLEILTLNKLSSISLIVYLFLHHNFNNELSGCDRIESGFDKRLV